MHALALALVLMRPGAALAQEETFGKSEAQILAMGENKWDAFYMAKAGQSTAAMVAMSSIYGAAMEHRNDQLAKHAPKSVQLKITSFRRQLNNFAGAAIDIGYNLSGGGTLWSQVSS